MGSQNPPLIGLLIGLVLAIIGGILVWIGSYITDRRKRNTESREHLRGAYSEWFTFEKITKQQILVLYSTFKDSKEIKNPEFILQESKEVDSTIRDLLRSFHNVCLLEKSEDRRDIISAITEHIEGIYSMTTRMLSSQRQYLDLLEKGKELKSTLENLANSEVSPEKREEAEIAVKEGMNYLNEAGEALRQEVLPIIEEMVTDMKELDKEAQKLFRTLAGKL